MHDLVDISSNTQTYITPSEGEMRILFADYSQLLGQLLHKNPQKKKYYL
jgi:hypothetical protein